MELLQVDTLEETFQKLESYARGDGPRGAGLAMETETIPFWQGSGRVLAENILSREDIPPAPRSVMDGYAVCSVDTTGASEGLPVFLRVTQEVEMGKLLYGKIGSGECAAIPTGGFLPAGCDAVVMEEYCETFGADQIAVYTAVSPGRNLVQTGDDVKKGETVLPRGKRLQAADLGVLAAIGKTEIPVYRPWRVHILSTGDEIVDPQEPLRAGKMRDVNSYTLSCMAQAYGFKTSFELLPDDEEMLETRVREAMHACDLVIVSGGSSQGKKDATAKVIRKLASAGVLTHGIAVKPGKPTVLGFDEPTRCALLGLPGHPVAAALLFDLLAGRLWKQLSGEEKTEKPRFLYGTLSMNLPASPGRETLQLVRVYEEDTEETEYAENAESAGSGKTLRVVPILGKSGMIRTLSEADGYLVMERDEEGLKQGAMVKVQLF